MPTTPDIFNAWREASRMAAEAERDLLQVTLHQNGAAAPHDAIDRARRLRSAASTLLEQLLVELQDERARQQVARLAGGARPEPSSGAGDSGISPLQ